MGRRVLKAARCPLSLEREVIMRRYGLLSCSSCSQATEQAQDGIMVSEHTVYYALLECLKGRLRQQPLLSQLPSGQPRLEYPSRGIPGPPSEGLV